MVDYIEQKNPIILEIGVHKGQFSKLLLKNLKPRKLILVDPWKAFDQEIYQNSWYGNKDNLGQKIQNKYYKDLKDYFKGKKYEKKIIIKKQTSDQFFIHNKIKFDLIYIDGNHLESYVKKDIKNSIKFLNNNGIIVLDDYAMTGWWNDGVTKAVKFYKKKKIIDLITKHSLFSYHHQCIIKPINT